MIRKHKMTVKYIALFILTAVLFSFFASSCKKPTPTPDLSEPEQPPIPMDEPEQKPEYPVPEGPLPLIQTGGNSVKYRAVGKYFYRTESDGYHPFYIKGVNMGLTEPTTDLENPNTTYETYMDWFNKIYEMNANTVRVFTVMNPDFYRAFYDFNQEKRLYLIQGIWFNENYMTEINDAFDDKIVDAFEKSIYETVDIIHGASSYTHYGQFRPAIYDKDISEYVVGYVLGLEWNYEFVMHTNEKNFDKISYNGEYITAQKGSSSFEIFLAQMGDYAIKFETQKYMHQTPLAFLNWSSTDILTHTNEPFKEEDAININTENIKTTNKYYAGLFGAVDIYPYYPDFMNYQPEYLNRYAPINTYRAYLNDLIKNYSVPLLVAEVGLSNSRGVAHESVMGYNQGGLSESDQGEFLSSMLCDIAREGYAGSLVFSWQDEWFKKTWNAFQYYPDKSDFRTPNLSSAEQSYGLLSFDTSVSYCDGDYSEWLKEKPIISTEKYFVYALCDPSYLHLYIESKGKIDFANQKMYIPISVMGNGSLFSAEYNLSFAESVDFLLVVNGEDNTRVLTDEYNDVFQYMYSIQKPIIKNEAEKLEKNKGKYNKINTFLSNEMYLPIDDKTIKPKYYESGKLLYGQNNPTKDGYNCQADFYSSNDRIEIRIPWYLINVANSAKKISIDDFSKIKKIAYKPFSDIKIGFVTDSAEVTTLTALKFEGFDKIKYNPRLKKSYYSIQKTYEELMK